MQHCVLNLVRAASRRYCSTAYPILSGLGSSAQQVLDGLSDTFSNANVSEPITSAQLIVGEVLGITNIDLLPQVIEHSHFTTEQLGRLEQMTQCRLARMPVQYILGYWDFRQIRIKTRPPVFIPRCETEELVGLVLDYLKSFKCSNIIQVLEIGCGSGVITLSILKEHKTEHNSVNIIAVDQSNSACSLTVENAMALDLLTQPIEEAANNINESNQGR